MSSLCVLRPDVGGPCLCVSSALAVNISCVLCEHLLDFYGVAVQCVSELGFV